MLCPHCQVDLHMTERQGIEIDYCPKCRGVWLDRGELDKIIEKSAQEVVSVPPPAATPPPTYQPAPRPPEPRYGDQRYGDHRYDERDPRYHDKRKKKSFLSELFD